MIPILYLWEIRVSTIMTFIGGTKKQFAKGNAIDRLGSSVQDTVAAYTTVSVPVASGRPCAYSRDCGTTVWVKLGAAHNSRMLAAPVFCRYSSRIGYSSPFTGNVKEPEYEPTQQQSGMKQQPKWESTESAYQRLLSTHQ
jgi:hypothetical protein